MNLSKTLGRIAIISISFTSCSKPTEKADDNNPPFISEVAINGMKNSAVVEAGAQMEITAQCTDNSSLKFLDLQTEFIGDETTQDKGAKAKWNTNNRFHFNGTLKHFSESLEVPVNATPGLYSLLLKLQDTEGNEAEPVEIKFELSDRNLPQFHLLQPDVDQYFSIETEDTLKFIGKITDDHDLSKIFIKLHMPDYPGKPVLYDNEFLLQGTQDSLWDFQKDGRMNIYIPATSVRGEYELHINAIDNDGQYNMLRGSIYVPA